LGGGASEGWKGGQGGGASEGWKGGQGGGQGPGRVRSQHEVARCGLATWPGRSGLLGAPLSPSLGGGGGGGTLTTASMGIPTLPAGVPCAGARSDSKVAAGTAGFVHASSAIAAPAGGGRNCSSSKRSRASAGVSGRLRTPGSARTTFVWVLERGQVARSQVAPRPKSKPQRGVVRLGRAALGPTSLGAGARQRGGAGGMGGEEEWLHEAVVSFLRGPCYCASPPARPWGGGGGGGPGAAPPPGGRCSPAVVAPAAPTAPAAAARTWQSCARPN